MAINGRIQLEDGSGNYQLEDGSGALASEDYVGLLSISDDFNRANLGSNWVTTGTPVTLDGTAVVGSTVVNGQRWVVPCLCTGWVFAQWTHKGGSFDAVSVAMPEFAQGVSLQSVSPFYSFRSQGVTSGVAITIKPAGVTAHTVLVSSATNLVVGDVIRLEYNGTTLNAYINGSLILTTNPSSPLSLQANPYVGFAHGSSAQSGTVIADDFSGGDFTPVAAVVDPTDFFLVL